MTQAPSKFYVRKASGLVREVTGIDVLFYNVFMISLTYVTWLVYVWVSYPGSSIAGSVLICMVGGVAQTIVYSLYSAVFPRSGGEYVYLTRSLNPALGFIFSWNAMLWFTWWAGATASFVSFSTITPALSFYGLLTNNQSMVYWADWSQSPIGIFTIGAVVILFLAGLNILGLKTYFKFQKIAFVIAMAGMVIGAAVMAVTTPDTFIPQFNQFMTAFTKTPDAYHAIIDTAKSTGYTGVAPFSMLTTFAITIWVFNALGFCSLSASFAGEIRNVRKSQLFGMTAGVLLSGLVFIAWGELGARAFGAEFIQAISYIDAYAPGVRIFPTTPFLTVFISIRPAAQLQQWS